jgi:hypothetical protein
MTVGQSCPTEVDWSLFNIEDERAQQQWNFMCCSLEINGSILISVW